MRNFEKFFKHGVRVFSPNGSGCPAPGPRRFHSPVELCGFDLRVRLCRVDAHVAEHGPYRFEVVLLLEDLHGDPMAEIVGFQLG